jgi:hypothetical protein
MRAFRISLAVAFLAMAVVLLGGHPVAAGERTATVKGIITLDGKPLAEGKIFFHLPDDQFVGARIKDGKYKVSRVPVGGWLITVEGAGVPAKYRSGRTTSLKVEILANATPGAYDIKLAK